MHSNHPHTHADWLARSTIVQFVPSLVLTLNYKKLVLYRFIDFHSSLPVLPATYFPSFNYLQHPERRYRTYELDSDEKSAARARKSPLGRETMVSFGLYRRITYARFGRIPMRRYGLIIVIAKINSKIIHHQVYIPTNPTTEYYHSTPTFKGK